MEKSYQKYDRENNLLGYLYLENKTFLNPRKTFRNMRLSSARRQELTLTMIRRDELTTLWREWRWGGVWRESAEKAMERDRKLFEEVKKNGSSPMLRFYSWKEPTLSYGRTQGIDAVTFSKYTKEGWKIVKRPTGGGKVFHKNDLCFSIIWRKQDRAIPWGVRDSYCAIHRWVQESLGEMGINTPSSTLWRVEDTPLEKGNEENIGWCFESPVENDLLCNGKKIVGGAQWRDGKVALHQGSIQIALNKLNLEIFKQKFSEMFCVSLQNSPFPQFFKASPHV